MEQRVFSLMLLVMVCLTTMTSGQPTTPDADKRDHDWYCFNLPNHQQCHIHIKPDPTKSQFVHCPLPDKPPAAPVTTTTTTTEAVLMNCTYYSPCNDTEIPCSPHERCRWTNCPLPYSEPKCLEEFLANPIPPKPARPADALCKDLNATCAITSNCTALLQKNEITCKNFDFNSPIPEKWKEDNCTGTCQNGTAHQLDCYLSQFQTVIPPSDIEIKTKCIGQCWSYFSCPPIPSSCSYTGSCTSPGGNCLPPNLSGDCSVGAPGARCVHIMECKDSGGTKKSDCEIELTVKGNQVNSASTICDGEKCEMSINCTGSRCDVKDNSAASCIPGPNPNNQNPKCTHSNRECAPGAIPPVYCDYGINCEQCTPVVAGTCKVECDAEWTKYSDCINATMCATTDQPCTTSTTTTELWTNLTFPPLVMSDTCPAREYFTIKTTWKEDLKTQVMRNDEHLLNGSCALYYRAQFSEHPNPTVANPDSIDFSCTSPYSAMPPEFMDYDVVRSMNMTKVRSELMPLKQRRTKEKTFKQVESPVECLDTWSWDKDQSDKVPDKTSGRYEIPEHCVHCSGTTRFDHTEENLKDTREELTGDIIPFAMKGQHCTLENEAYLHGSIITKLVLNRDLIEGEGFGPWGNLHKYWPNLVNLNVAELDVNAKNEKECLPEGDYENLEEHQNMLLHGDCIFNQRLAKEPLTDEDQVNFKTKFTKHMCRGSQTFPEKHEETNVKVDVVALGCAPYHFLICDQEYNAFQVMNSTCICHPLYSVPNPDPKSVKAPVECLPMAGVPCRFNRTKDEPLSELLINTDCAPNMICTDIKEIDYCTGKTKHQCFSYMFAGFGMSPIARDYMVEKATAMCTCGVGLFPTPMNECLKPESDGAPRVEGVGISVFLAVAVLLLDF